MLQCRACFISCSIAYCTIPSNKQVINSAIKNSKQCLHSPCVQIVKDALEGKEENNRVWTGPSEEDPTYRLLVDCNQLAVDIDNEIGIIHNFMRDKYRLKFPELESLVHHPIDYARVVQAIGMS